MKISLNWLRELVDRPLEGDEVARQLTLAGLEVEARIPFAPLKGVVVAKVVNRRPHPEAAKLTLVEVALGDEPPTQVVCGASNVPAPGGRVVWAPPGATLPGGITIGEKAVRGVVSPGMLCAEDELGLGSSHEGLLVLTDSDGLAPGDDFAQRLGLPDEIWELNVTPNRPDCLGHLGVAREVAALVGGELRRPALPALPSGGGAAKIELLDPDGCPRYCGLVLEGVKVQSSPLWLRLRLTALGVRPISNVVDATNLMMLLWSQPLHAFDLDRLAGGGVAIRRARPDEAIETLDAQRRTLCADDLVIADQRGPVAIAGVMGGAGSEVSAQTTRLFLESAFFEPTGVRRTARRLGLHTEASHRFERGTDPSLPAEVARHLAAQLLTLAGGRVVSALCDRYPQPIAPKQVLLRPTRTSAILGLPVAAEEQARLLASIGLENTVEPEGLRVSVPTFRPDLTREIDLIEEIARLHGYEKIGAKMPLLATAPGPLCDAAQSLNERARDALAGLGLDEVVTYGFVGPQHGRPFGGAGEAPHVRIVNPLREEQSVMRRSLLPGLCLALQRNLSRGNEEVRLFEVGAVFWPRPGELPDERWHVAGLLHGHAEGWLKPGPPLDFFDAKGVVEELLAALGHAADFRPGDALAGLHPGIQAVVAVAGSDIGAVGELHPQAARTLGLDGRPLVFELDLEALPTAAPVRAAELPRFPAVSRDLSFFIDERVRAAEVRVAIERVRDPLCVEVWVREEYTGDKRPPGKKGMLWSFTYRAADRTLTDVEVQQHHDALVAALGRELGFERR